VNAGPAATDDARGDDADINAGLGVEGGANELATGDLSELEIAEGVAVEPELALHGR
jgi:hypothetical protein